MNEDGFAGDILTDGEIGEVTVSGPQVFLGYVGNPESTARTISKDKILYTGDLGKKDGKGRLVLVGRSKLVIKPKGYQIYPPEVENHILQKLHDRAAHVGLVGHPHDVFSEAVVAFVEKKKTENGDVVELTAEDVMNSTLDIAAYKRPSLVILLEPDQMPLNRVGKTDYQVLKELAMVRVKEEREKGRWDKENLSG